MTGEVGRPGADEGVRLSYSPRLDWCRVVSQTVRCAKEQGARLLFSTVVGPHSEPPRDPGLRSLRISAKDDRNMRATVASGLPTKMTPSTPAAIAHQRTLCDTRAIRSSALERNSFRIGDVFKLL
jgi:hypothetical protein